MKKILKRIVESKKYNLQILDYRPNEIIFNEDDKCDEVGVLIKGKIKIASFLENGKELIYNEIVPGEMFGENLIFSSHPYFRGDVIAEENSIVVLIARNELLKLLQEDQEFLLAYLNKQSDFGKSLNLKIKILTFNNADERILYFLDMHDGEVEFKSITRLANELYLSREVLSRTLHRMEKENLIIIRDKKIIKL